MKKDDLTYSEILNKIVANTSLMNLVGSVKSNAKSQLIVYIENK